MILQQLITGVSIGSVYAHGRWAANPSGGNRTESGRWDRGQGMEEINWKKLI